MATHGEANDSSDRSESAAVPRPPWRAAWVGAGVVFIVYVLTMGRGLGYYDSAELALVARQIGVSHPIGQPLHTLLGAIASRLTWWAPTLGLNLLSATAGALAVPTAVWIGWRVAGRPHGHRLAITVTAPVVLVALHPTVWEAATRIEVYPLAIAPCLLAVARAWDDLEPGAPPRGFGRWWVTGGLLGLAASANAFMAVLAAIAVAPAVLVALVRRRLGLPGALGALVGGLAGLVPYLQIPLTAGFADDARFVWGTPGDLPGLAAYFGGVDYARNTGVDLGLFLHQGMAWVGWAGSNGHLVLLVLGVAGLALARPGVSGARFLGTLLVTVASVALIARYTIFHPAIPDYVDYQALALLLASSGIAALAVRLHASPRGTIVAVTLLILVAALCLLPEPSMVSRVARAGDRTPDLLATRALDEAPPNAVLVASSDHLVFPMFYLQAAGHRPDVVIVPWGLASTSWYWGWLRRLHPALPAFSLRGPGGRAGRVRRLLAADPARALLVESLPLAASIGGRVCSVGMLARIGVACEGGPSAASDATAALRRWLENGGPTTDEVLALVAVTRGDLLWAGGWPTEAFHAYGAGVPEGLREPADPPVLAGAVGRLPGDLDRPWDRFVPLGEPARALYRQGQLLLAAGAPDPAAAKVWRAARLGLPEAVRLTRGVSGP